MTLCPGARKHSRGGCYSYRRLKHRAPFPRWWLRGCRRPAGIAYAGQASEGERSVTLLHVRRRGPPGQGDFHEGRKFRCGFTKAARCFSSARTTAMRSRCQFRLQMANPNVARPRGPATEIAGTTCRRHRRGRHALRSAKEGGPIAAPAEEKGRPLSTAKIWRMNSHNLGGTTT